MRWRPSPLRNSISRDRLFVVMGTTTNTVDQAYRHVGFRYAGPQIRHAAAAGRQVVDGQQTPACAGGATGRA